MSLRPERAPSPTATALTVPGFTIVELLVVMGMLGMFLIFLTQMLSQSLRIWQMGEGQASLEARAGAALRVLTADFELLRAVSDRQFAPGRENRFAQLQRSGKTPPHSGRLYAHWQAFAGSKPVTADLALEKPEAVDWYPEIRMVVTLEQIEAATLLERRLRRRIIEEEGQLLAEDLEARVRERLAEVPGSVPAEVALRVLPTGEEDGCYLALHRDVQLLDERVRARWVDLAPLPPPSQPLQSNLLWVEFRFRSQATESWEAAPGTPGAAENCWDSARAGTFPAGHPVLAFAGDLDQQSLMDPLDDVMPSWVQVRVTVDEGPSLATTALLARAVDATTTDIRIEFADRLPQADEQPHLKIGGEWIRYRSRSGDRLLGVKRGARSTRARPHRAGARVHAGREAMVRIPIAVAREYWNVR